jgi:hypothetical protein
MTSVNELYYFKVSQYHTSSGFDDILFEVNDSLEDFPEHVVALKNDIEKTVKVVFLLFKDDQKAYNTYYDRLLMIADLAFNGRKEQSAIAKNSLELLKRDLIHEVGPRIRTTLLFRYIKASIFPILLLLLFSLGFILIESSASYILKLALVAVGSSIGCWVSLAVRTRSIEFEQILPILSDHRGIHSRIIFVMVFAVMMAILMKSGLISIQLGEFSSSSIETDNYAAVTAGLIMGFAEKLFVDKLQSKVDKVNI